MLLYGERVEESVLAQVPHWQYVFTVPRLLRSIPSRAGAPGSASCAASPHGLLSRAYATACPGARSALILFVQTFGDLENFHPYVHVLAAEGAFPADGMFVSLPPVAEDLLRQGFRQAVLEFPVTERAIAEGEGAALACQDGYDAATGTALYRSKMYLGLKRNFQVMPGPIADVGPGTAVQLPQ